jgi:hypothetical protein
MYPHYGFKNNCDIRQDGEGSGFNSQLVQHIFLFSASIQTFSAAQPASYQMRTGGLSFCTGVKLPEHGADNC